MDVAFWAALTFLAIAPRLVLCSSSSMCDWRFVGAMLPALALFSLATFLLVFGGVPGASTPSTPASARSKSSEDHLQCWSFMILRRDREQALCLSLHHTLLMIWELMRPGLGPFESEWLKAVGEWPFRLELVSGFWFDSMCLLTGRIFKGRISLCPS